MQYLDISLLYILARLVKRATDFFKHWYINGFFQAMRWTLDVYERLDHKFALRITVRYWMQPLYQDYSIIGYIFGFIFRTVRIIAALIIYTFVFFIALFLFLLWAAIPVAVVYSIFKNL